MSPVAATSVIRSCIASAMSFAHAEASPPPLPSGVPNDIEITSTPGIPVTASLSASVMEATVGE